MSDRVSDPSPRDIRPTFSLDFHPALRDQQVQCRLTRAGCKPLATDSAQSTVDSTTAPATRTKPPSTSESESTNVPSKSLT
jgi:hypothetical protein